MSIETQERRVDLSTILKVATEKNATDIHLQVGLPPVLRIQKKLVALGTEKLSPERVEELMFPIMNDHQKVLFKQNMEYDFSYGVKGLARFRINVFRQRETMAAALRKIPYDIPAMGMMTMDQALKNLYERGIISYEDAIDHAFDPKELQRLLGRLS